MERIPNLGSLAALIAFAFAFFPAATTGEEIDANQYRSIRWSHFNGKKYAFGLSDDAYKKMATWYLEKKDPPPVSPQAAYLVAKAWIDNLEIDSDWLWEVDGITLDPINSKEGKWIWQVSFKYNPKEGGLAGQPTVMRVLVTMDGNLIKPIVSDKRRET